MFTFPFSSMLMRSAMTNGHGLFASGEIGKVAARI
jgi:hypothetical protein